MTNGPVTPYQLTPCTSESLTALLLTSTLTERAALEESGGISGPMEAMHVLWPFRTLVRHPITMLLYSYPQLKS